MKTRLIQTAENAFAFVASLVQHHPKQLTAAITALLLGGAGATFAVASLAPDAALLPVRTVVEDVTPLPLLEQTESLQNQAMRLYRSDTTRAADTAEALLKRLGVYDPQAAAFIRSDRLVQQTLLGRGGRNVTVEASEGNTLLKLSARWSPEDDGMFKRLSVEKSATGFQSRVETLPMTASSRLASGTIHSSLFAATDDARIPDSIAMQLAEIFSGDIDFHRALRKGDRFSVTYETLEGDGEPLRAGRVLNAEFVNAGKSFQAMWFQEAAATGQAGVLGPGGGQLIFHAGVNRCLFALQNAERRQHRRCGADCGHDLACGGKLGADLAHRGIGFQVVHTRNAAGQDGGIKSGIIQLFGQGIRHNADAAGRFDDLFAAHGSNRYFHTGTAQQIHTQKALALFQAGRKKDNSFAHTKHSFTK